MTSNKTGRKTPPVVDIPIDLASEELTGFEVLAIGARFRAHLADLDPLVGLAAVVWCFENRDDKVTSWNTIAAWTQRQVADYFADPSEDPDDDQGKETTGDVTTTEPWPSGASTPDSPQLPISD